MGPEGGGAEDIQPLLHQSLPPEGIEQGIHRGEEVLLPRCDSQPPQLFHIIRRASGGVVGQKEIPPACIADVAEELRHAGKQRLIQIQCPIHIQ
jgi:hypothetical protein